MRPLEISLRVKPQHHGVIAYFEGRYFRGYDQAREFETTVRTEARKAAITVDYSPFDCIHADPCSLNSKEQINEDQALEIAMNVAAQMGVELILQ
jgi:hypothetical protein